MEDKKYGLDEDYIIKHNYSEEYFTEEESSEDNGEYNKKKKKHKLNETGVQYFVLGFLVCAAIVSIVVFLVMGGKIITKDEAEYYEGLNEKYGKDYQMELLIEEEALYDCDTSGMQDAIPYVIMSGLKDDKYAAYYTAEEYEEFCKAYTDSYSGVGLVISTESDGSLVVKRTISGGPAEKAGIKTGDVIVAIDGKTPEDGNEAVDLLSGSVGTKVTITVKRNGKQKDYDMYRAEVEEESVSYSVYDADNKIGYVKISTFRDGTAKSVKSAVKDLKNKGCDKVIFDIRQNTGGITDEGIDVADYLLPSCTIMQQKIKGTKKKNYTSDESNCGVKYVLLVDEYTASASEILTAAIKDNAGGTIIGSKTYGKGLIQAVHQLKDGSAVKFTVGEYFSPKGNKIDGIGIEPDIYSSDPVGTAVQELCK